MIILQTQKPGLGSGKWNRSDEGAGMDMTVSGGCATGIGSQPWSQASTHDEYSFIRNAVNAMLPSKIIWRCTRDSGQRGITKIAKCSSWGIFNESLYWTSRACELTLGLRIFSESSCLCCCIGLMLLSVCDSEHTRERYTLKLSMLRTNLSKLVPPFGNARKPI